MGSFLNKWGGSYQVTSPPHLNPDKANNDKLNSNHVQLEITKMNTVMKANQV